MRSKLRMWLIVGCLAALVNASLAAGALSGAEKEPAAKAEAGAAAEGSSELATDPLSFKVDLALWTFVVFGVLCAVLWKFAWGPIIVGLDAREKGIASNIDAEERSYAEAKELLADYEKKLANAQHEVRQLIDQAHKDAEIAKQGIEAEAKANATAEKERAVQEIGRARDAALKELSEHSANIAVDLAGKIVRSKLTAEEQSALVNDAMSKFAASSPSQN